MTELTLSIAGEQVDHLTAETQSLGAEVEELNKFQWQLQQDWRSQKNELRRLEAIVLYTFPLIVLLNRIPSGSLLTSNKRHSPKTTCSRS